MLTLVIGCTAGTHVFAGGEHDGERRSGGREEVHEQRQGGGQAYRVQGQMQEGRGQQQRDYREQPQMQQRDQREQRYQPQGQQRFDQQQQFQPQQPQQAQPNDNGRHNGRMSPEDRRALRRQIDQASHDIYVPGR